MSEILQPPEPELTHTIKIRCHCCSREFTTDRENTVYFVYGKAPWFNHTRTVCEDGGINVKRIHVEDKDERTFANQFMKVYGANGFCDDEDYKDYFKEQYNITDLEYKPLTPRQQNLINYMAYMMTDENLYNEFG